MDLPRGYAGKAAAAALACAAVTTLASRPVTAQPDSVAVARMPLPSETPLPGCFERPIKDELTASAAQRGVQQRDFLKRRKVAVAMRGGLFNGDLASSHWLAGGELAFWLTEDFALSVGVDYTRISVDLDRPLATFFGDDRFEAGPGYVALGNAVWSPIHAKLRLGDHLSHADVLFYAGTGKLLHDSVQGMALDGGMAIEALLSRWVTLRLDIRELGAIQEVAGETRFTNNIITTAGLTFWIPTGGGR